MTLPGLQIRPLLFPLWEQSTRDCQFPRTLPNSVCQTPPHKSQGINTPGCCGNQGLYHPIMTSLPTGFLGRTSTGRKPLVRSHALILGPPPQPSPQLQYPPPMPGRVKMEPPSSQPLPPLPTGPQTPRWPNLRPLEVPEALLLPQEMGYLKRKRVSSLDPALPPPHFLMEGYPLPPRSECPPTPMPGDLFGSLKVEVSY